MPVNAPEFGEVWTTSDATSGRIMQGIVAEVTPTRVLFVGLSGARVAVPLLRLGTTWNFIQATPRRTMPNCERLACPNPGMITYDRTAFQGRNEYVCPKHAPLGVQCRITANYDPAANPTRVIRPGYECHSTPCPNCAHLDPAEDVRVAAFPARLWTCTACRACWVTIPVSDNVPEAFEGLIERIMNTVRRENYQEEGLTVLRFATWETLCAFRDTVRDTVLGGDRLTLRVGVHANLSPTVFTEQVREQFQAILRVRALHVRPVERPVQRLGGAPNRAGVVGRSVPAQTGPLTVAPSIPSNLVYRPPGVQGDATAAADALRRLRRLEEEQTFFQGPTSIEEPVSVAQAPIERNSRWVQRLAGTIVEVVEVLKATDGSEVVSFRRASSSDGGEAAVSLTREDFHKHHRPLKKEPEKEKPKANIEVAVNEEWAHKTDGTGVRITSVDYRREIVHADDSKTRKHRQIPFSQFAAGQWRKIIRRSVYDRIRNPEVSLTSMLDED